MLDKTKVRTRMAINGFHRQKDLANAMGASPSNVSLWVNGERVPDLVNAVRMARVLNCKVDDLLAKDAA